MLKRCEKLMPAAWYPTRWRDWCASEDMKKEKEPFLIDEK